MRTAFALFALLIIAACSGAENRTDGVSSSEARALDAAAAKVEANSTEPVAN